MPTPLSLSFSRFPSSLSTPPCNRRTTPASCSTADNVPDPAVHFNYAAADPVVRFPDLYRHFPTLVTAHEPPPQNLPPPLQRESSNPVDDDEAAASGESFEPLGYTYTRTRAKKLSKLALKRAKDWRQRVATLSDRILSLPPSSFVADALDSRDIQMTPSDYAFLVKSLGSRSWARALETFEYLCLRGSPVPRLLSAILSILSRSNQLLLAEEIFTRFVSDPGPGVNVATVQVYNAMMGAYARACQFQQVHTLLLKMQEKGLEPDLVSFNTLINARSRAGNLEPGEAVGLVAEVRRSGVRPDTITYNTLISACACRTYLEDAVKLFEEMTNSGCHPDLWTYNAMVSVYGQCGAVDSAVGMFHELREKGFVADAVTYNSLLYAYAKDGNEKKVEKVCEEMARAGFKKDEITYNTIIHMYGKQGRLDWAIGLYNEMRSDGCSPDAVTYTVLIDSLGKANRVSEAGKVMTEMVDTGLKPTLRTFSALICGYAKAGMCAEAEQTFDHMVRTGIKPDLLAYSVMIDILLRSDETKKALVLYRATIRDGCRLDEGLLKTMLATFGKRNDDERIQEIIGDMKTVYQMSSQAIISLLVRGQCYFNAADMLKNAVAQGFQLDVGSLVPILDEYESLGKNDEALSLLNYIREHLPKAHPLISESLILLLCKNRQAMAALEEYNKMTMFGHRFTRIKNVHECLVACCEDAGLFFEASQLFSDMKFLSIEPTEKMFESMISIYCKIGFPETAHQLMDQAIQGGNVFVNSSAFISIIKAYGKLKLWQRAESLVREYQQFVDRAVWNALIYAYAESGCYEQARVVFNMMMKNGLQPTVDSVNGMMQALIADGRLDELYVVVQELQDMNFKISKGTILIMLDAFARAGNIFEAKKIYGGMKAAGYLPNMHLYRSMIALLSHGKRVRDVESMVAEMEGAGFTPDIFIYNSLLKMYTGIDNFKKAMQVYEMMSDSGIKADEDTFNTLIMIYSKDMRPEEAFTVLSEMRKHGFEPKLDSYKSLMAACGKVQLWERAEYIFHDMRSKGHYRLDRSVYHIMMKIHRSSGNHAKAEHLLTIMEDDDVNPTIATMHMLMTSYGTGRQPQQAENVLKNLKASGVELGVLPYSTVIDAYLKNSDYDIGIAKLREMMDSGIQPNHRIWTCFIRAASLCEQLSDAFLLLNALNEIGFSIPMRILMEKSAPIITEVDNLLEELGPLEDNACFNFVNALEDLLWAFERRAMASLVFQLAIKRNVYRRNLYRVEEKNWGADFRKLSAGAALVGLTLWLDAMQDASLQGSPESPKSVVLITGGAEYNMVSLESTLRAYLWEMGSPFLPCKTRSGVLVAKAHSLRMWLKDSSFCMDLELKDAPALPERNSMKLTEGCFLRAGLVPAFKDINERLGEVRPKKFARLALLSEESRHKVIEADIQGRKEKLEKMKKRVVTERRRPRLRTARFMRRQHKTPA